MVEDRSSPAQQLGGASGMIYTALPIAVFVAINATLGLGPAVAAAVGAALMISLVRVLRKEPLQPSLSGLIGVLVAAAVAAWTGSANGFFLLGIWANLAGAILVFASVLIRYPITGLVWAALHQRDDTRDVNGKTTWRSDPHSLRGHDIASIALGVLFATRFAVQQWLYQKDATGWLALAKLTMGAPLLAVALLIVFWAFRRSTRQASREPA